MTNLVCDRILWESGAREMNLMIENQKLIQSPCLYIRTKRENGKYRCLPGIRIEKQLRSSKKYRRCQINQSMSRRGHSRNKSLVERIFRSLKTEWIPKTGYRTFAEVQRSIMDYLTGDYSQYRPHQYKGGLTPNESERLFWFAHKTVASFT